MSKFRSVLRMLPFLLLAVIPARSSTETVLHNFEGGTDGSDPLSDLLYQSSTGLLYGTTDLGGAGASCANPTTGCGTVFAISPNGSTYSVLHQFQGAPDGANPQAGLIADGSGNLYGTTYAGGANNLGTVFELINLGGGAYMEQVIYSFSSRQGSHPESKLAIDGLGNLYGTTYSGGAHGKGTVFELSPAGSGIWTESVLFSFDGADGENPKAGVIFSSSDVLWGTTYHGGSDGLGTVFQLTLIGSVWDENFFYSFTGATGQNPAATVALDDLGNVYGTTQFGGTTTCFVTAGCGTVFELQPSGDTYSESVIYSLMGTSDGAEPLAHLAVETDLSGFDLYGTASEAGDFTSPCSRTIGCGSAFVLCSAGSSCAGAGPWMFWTLTNFDKTDGRKPAAGLFVFTEPPEPSWNNRRLPPPSHGGCTYVCICTTSSGGTTNEGTVCSLSN